MRRLLVVPILLLLVTRSASGAPRDEETGEPIDLFWVHSLALVEDRFRLSEADENLREALTRWLPGVVVQVSSEGADLLVDYSSFQSSATVEVANPDVWMHDAVFEESRVPESDASPIWIADELPMLFVRKPFDVAQGFLAHDLVPSMEHRASWSAKLYRLDCQSPQFGEKPTPAIDGRCENRVYVRVALGTMKGTAEDEARAVQAFADQLREAMFLSVPAESPGN